VNDSIAIFPKGEADSTVIICLSVCEKEIETFFYSFLDIVNATVTITYVLSQLCVL
jgi:hypothetical protein